MSSSNTTTPPPIESPAVVTAEEAGAKAVRKRYESLMTVRNKAIKGKGAWYWAHLEPLLVHNSDTGLAKAVKLKCCLCDTMFSASNPSRTASEHLKRGTCPNFTSSAVAAASAMAGPTAVEFPHHNHRKRSGGSGGGGASAVPISYNVLPISTIDPSRYCSEMGYSPVSAGSGGGGGGGGTIVAVQQQQHQQVLSGGKDDLVALQTFEDSIKRLKSPKASPGPALSKNQVDCALDYLSEWVYESCGSVSFSSLEHPKLKSFLHQVGMPSISKREFFGSKLDAKFEEAKHESQLRIRDSAFFQIASEGWKSKSFEENLVSLAVNLPNGTSLYRRAVFAGGHVPSKYAEEVLWETIADICGHSVQDCAGIVSDKFKNSALKNLESQYPWMVNLSCQCQAFNSLIKDFYRELPLFKHVAENCLKLANFVNNKTQVRNSFCKFQIREFGHACLLRAPTREHEISNFENVYAMMEDIISFARVLQLVLLDESYKVVSMEDPAAREFGEMIRDVGFWNDLDAVRSLVKLIKEMAHEIEIERPLVGQCLPLWDELRTKAKDWCTKFHISEGLVDKVIERRFRRNYHAAWATAYILDPLYLIRDSTGKYLPPFKCLTPDQEKDVDKLITRLVSRDEAHIVLMELMKWRTEGLEPVYAQAVQMKERDPRTGKMKLANPQSSRIVWEKYLPEFKSLGKVAVRLIFLHASSRGFKCNLSFLRWVQSHGRSRAGMERVQKMIFIAAHSKLERRDFSCDEDKDAEIFTSANGEDDVLNEVFVDP